ncbi:hypothetical protein BDY24DRAFT_368344 [Mrakia frigida]|uniref:SH3 domain-containing protein n=1 Tax=Mrakia frigida TaxID=29902 RepID=UPI003FCC18AD
MSLNPSDALLAHTLSSITSSLQVLSSLNLLSEADSSLIRSKLPPPNALSSSSSQQSHHALSPSPSNGSYNNNSVPSPYPAPIYGHGNSNDSQSSFGGGGAHRVPPPLPGRSYPGLGEARAVWDYHGGAPDDLIFKKDDIIVITEEMNPEWFKGHLSTDTSLTPRIGLFPSTYVIKLS